MKDVQSRNSEPGTRARAKRAMGNAQSPPSSDPRSVTASRAFTPKELDDLRSLFKSLASQSHSNGEFISPSVFQDRLPDISVLSIL
ncbi:hypothetical protein L6164_033949 [Bauhinia variegata]|uniref:Uncharacterized protein n=1 Tax=Bauhinia variegata TaxID=167791 RepID=A0ACB9KTW5_BAUVA|nr:hypothetical protein L6164_033949 [Bauhinia variegata]